MDWVIVFVVAWAFYHIGKAAATPTDEEMLRRLVKKQLDGRLLEMTKDILAEEYGKVSDKLLERRNRD